MELHVNPVCPLIDSFFERITQEQWTSLKSGCPDDATKIVLAELILDTIASVTNSVFTALKNSQQPQTEKDVLVRLDNVLPQISSQVLGIPNEVDSDSSRRLTDLIAEEVRENISSAISQSLPIGQSLLDQRIIPHHRVTTMVSQAAKMVKEFVVKVKTVFSCGKPKQKKKGLIMVDVKDKPEVEEGLMLPGSDRQQVPQEASEDERRSETSQNLQEETRQEKSPESSTFC